MKKVLLFSLVALIVCRANAQWVTNGPYGGYVRCFAFNGSSVFAGTSDGGVFRCTNNGNTWSSVSNGLPPYTQVTSLATLGNYIFAGVIGSGVYVSTDDGNNWSAVNIGLTNTLVSSLVVSGTTLYAGTGNSYYGDINNNYGNGVYVSNDSGASWTGSGQPYFDIGSLAVYDTTVYAGGDNAVYATGNKGTNWTKLAYGLSMADAIWCLGVLNDSTIFAGTFGSGIYVSTDNGATWNPSTNGVTTTIAFSFLVNGTNIFAGTDGEMLISENGGSSWTNINANLPPRPYAYAMGFNGTDIFAGITSDSMSGIYTTNNNGSSWTAKNTGLTNMDIGSIATAPVGVFTAAFGEGVFLSTDNGANWITKGLSSEWVYSVASEGTNIFAGTEMNGVYLSTDNGNTWTPVNNGLPSGDAVTLVLASDTNIFALSEGGLYLSNNNGASWIADDTDITGNIWSIAVNGQNVVAGTYYNGVFFSDNLGHTWAQVNSGLTDSSILSLSFNGSEIFAGTKRGVFVTNNNGANWTKNSTGLPDTAVYSFAFRNDSIFAGTYYGLYVSDNNGSNWALLDSTIPQLPIYSLAVTDSSIFLGTEGRSIWQLSPSSIPTTIQKTSQTSGQFRVYPNPTISSFIIETTGTGSQQLQVFDLTGQLLLSQTIQNNKTTIDVSSFAPGVYLVSLKSSEGVSTQKLIMAR